MQIFDGQLEKIRLQKLLFLFSSRQAKADYDFIPYRFGCFSYSANADMTAMARKGGLSETETTFTKIDSTDYLKQLKPDDKKYLLEVKAAYGNMSADALMKHTYINYPFYATNSEVAEKILNKEELERVKKANPTIHDTILYTIGYEGISLEEYLVRLIKNDIKILIDVRNNPLSMKFGFNKNQLKKYCESLGLIYLHLPEFGIQAELRQELNSQIDYDNLFADYRKNNLTRTIKGQAEILSLLKQHKRVALTCFEANICQCHRKHLAEAIENLPGFNYKVKHI